MSDAITTIDAFRQELSNAETIGEKITMRNWEATAAKAAKALGLIEEANQSKERALWAEWSIGGDLKGMEKADGQLLRGNTMLPRGETPTYAEIGIQKMQAHRWQTMAALTEEEFTEYITVCLEDDSKELTSGGAYNLGKKKLYQYIERPLIPDIHANINLVVAVIKSAIDEHDKRWLLSDQCHYYFDTLILPKEAVMDWARSGCPSIEAMLNRQIEKQAEETKRLTK